MAAKALGGLLITTYVVARIYPETIWAPGRALVLLFKPNRVYACRKQTTDSVRKSETQWIKDRVVGQQNGGGTMAIVCGPRGIGKTTAIRCATRDMRGIIKIPGVAPETTYNELMNSVCYKITGLKGEWRDNEVTLKHTLDWYKTFANHAPLVIIEADKRPICSSTPTAVLPIAYNLANNLGLTVLVDAGENALSGSTVCQDNLLKMEPLSNEMMRSLPDYSYLSPILKSQGNEEVVLAVCGGSPLLLNRICSDVKRCEMDREKEWAVRGFVEKKLHDAYVNINQALKSNPKINKVREFF
jgi:hypothetical protein